MNCISDSSGKRCSLCGWAYKGHGHFPKHTCKASKPKSGPGDFLHLIILKRVGEGPTRKCNCEDRIREMNAWGPDGCRENIEKIVGWLVAEANKRGWWRFVVAVPGSRYFVKRMVLSAIVLAETEKPISSLP